MASDKNIVLQSFELAQSLDQQRSPKLTSFASLPPADLLGARFCQWFNHPWNFIFAPQPAIGEKPDWKTENGYPIQPRELWDRYQDTNELIGLRFAKETCYGLIDIDQGSPYHPVNDFSAYKDVLGALEEIGLCRSVSVQSSYSQGIHIYFPFLEARSSFKLASAVKYALEDAGLYLGSGQLEIFPNKKAYSKGKPSNFYGHRLPLQVGSYLLDEEAHLLSDNLADFLDALDVAAAHQDMVKLDQAIAAAEKRNKLRYISGTSSRAQQWKRYLESSITQGWTGEDQTNDLLREIATYGIVFQKITGSALVNYVEATAIAAPGYKQHCGHQHNIRQRAAEWAKCADGYYTPYCSFPDRYGRSFKENIERRGQQNNIVEFPSNKANVQRSQETAERIQQAMTYLIDTGNLPTGITARATAVINTIKELTGSGMSLKTLYRPCHKSLWQPKQQKSPEPAQGETLHPTSEIALNSTISESPEPAQGETLHPTPLYEGFCSLKKALALSPPLAVPPGCILGGADFQSLPIDLAASTAPTPIADPITPAPTADPDDPAASTAPAPTVDPNDLLKLPVSSDPEVSRRLTRIFLAANSHADKSLRGLSRSESRILGFEERARFKQIVKARFLYESGEPIYMDRVRRWAAANPEDLQEALPQPAESVSKPLPLKVGDRIWWDNCPGHCYSMNPFTITAIDGEMVSLDVYFEPVPMSQLRR